LPVELREVAGPRMTAHRQSRTLGPREQARQHSRVVMHVVVGIYMGGGSADELQEARELAIEFPWNALRVVRVQLEMGSGAQSCARTPERGRVLARWSIHHQARAREDALAMRLDDGAVDAAREAEVISGDDEPLHR